MPRIRKIIPGVDPKLLIKDAAKLLPDPARRVFLRGGVSIGALMVLTGCDIIDSDAAEGMLRKISKFNDRVQAWLFNPNTLAPEYPESAITRPFPFNGYYPEDEAPEVDGADLQARSRRTDRQQGAVDAGAALRAAAGNARSPATSASKAGARSAHGRACGCRNSSSGSAPTPARNTSGSNAPRAIPTPSTWRPRCIRRRNSSFKFDNQILPRKYGFPMKCRMPTKLGFKNPKYITAIYVQNNDAGGYWENQGYNWFSGL